MTTLPVEAKKSRQVFKHKQHVGLSMNFLIALFLLFFVPSNFSFSNELSVEEKVLNQISQGCPPWMEKQITKDLLFFQNQAISLSLCKASFKAMPLSENVVEFNLFENKVSVNKYIPQDPNNDNRIASIKETLEHLCTIQSMPNVTFYVFLHDGFMHIEPHSNPFLNAEKKFPIFAMSREFRDTKAHSILMPDFEALRSRYQVLQNKDVLTYQIPWQSKKNRLIWRGCFGQTASDNSSQKINKNNIHLFSRIRLCELSKEFPNLINAKLTTLCKTIPHVEKLYGKWKSYEDLFKYKYQMLIHGNAASYGRAGWRFFSNSLTFIAASNWEQWYSNELIPYVHYVPVKADLNDLVEKVLWAQQHDKEAETIAKNAREFALSHLTISDHLIYLYFLIERYSHLNFVD